MSLPDIEHDNPAVGFALRDIAATIATYRLSNGEAFDLFLHAVIEQAMEASDGDRLRAGQLLTQIFGDAVADVLDPNREKVVQ